MHFIIIACIFFWVQRLNADSELVPQIPKFDEVKKEPATENKKDANTNSPLPANETFNVVQPEQLNVLPQLWGAHLALKSPVQGNWRLANSAIINLNGAYVMSPDSQITFLKVANISFDMGYAYQEVSASNRFQLLQLQVNAFEQRKLSGLNLLKSTQFLRLISDLAQNLTYIDWVTQSLGWAWHYPEDPNPYLGKSYFLVQAGLGLSSTWVTGGTHNFTVRLPLLVELRLRLSSFPYDAAFWVEACRSYYGSLTFYEESARAQLQIAKSITNSRFTVGAWAGVQYHSLQNFPQLPVNFLQQYYIQTGIRIWW